MKERTNHQGEVVKTTAGKIWEVEKHILIVEPYPGANISLEDAVEQVAAALKMANDEKWVILVDMREVNSVSKEAREHFTDDSFAKGRIGIGMIVNSYFSKIIANFFIAYSKPPYPIQLFKSKEKAIVWLRKILGNG